MNSEERKVWGLLTILVATVAFGLGCLFVYATKSPSTRTAQPLQTGAGSIPSLSKKLTLAAPEPPEAAFTSAMVRFAEAVRAHPEMSGEEMIATVNAGAAAGSPKPCPFEWISGEAELQVQQDEFGKPSLTSTVKSCTAAIEGLPSLRSASLP